MRYIEKCRRTNLFCRQGGALMKKAVVFFLIIALAGFALGSCEREVVTYCPFCGQSGLKEVSDYNETTGKTEIYYKCTNDKCGKTFGAGQPSLAAVTGGK
jgi:hypothetical protein